MLVAQGFREALEVLFRFSKKRVSGSWQRSQPSLAGGGASAYTQELVAGHPVALALCCRLCLVQEGTASDPRAAELYPAWSWLKAWGREPSRAACSLLVGAHACSQPGET